MIVFDIIYISPVAQSTSNARCYNSLQPRLNQILTPPILIAGICYEKYH